MVITTALIATGVSWVANEVFSVYKEKYVTTGLKTLLFETEEYTIQLNKVIIATIAHYEKTYPPTGNFPFYHHKETFSQLSKFILFKDEGENILETIKFNELENIDKPSSEQVEHFYNYFVDQIQSNEKLKDFYIEENYKSKIFEIYREISLIRNIIEDFIKTIPKSDTIIKSWVDQIYDNLQKLKSATALDEITRFENEILPANTISDRNKAFIFFVKGLCLNENIKPIDAIEYFNQACKLDPENQSYKSWYHYLQYLFNYSDELLENIKLTLNTNPFDPLLNSVLAMEELNKTHIFASGGTPLSIQNNIRYKRIIYRYYLINGLISQALDYFQNDHEDIDNQLNQVSIDNFGYLDFYLQLNFLRLLEKYPNNLFFEVNPELKNSIELQNCITFIEKFLSKIKDSEKKSTKGFYEYLYKICLFFKEGDKKHLNSAYSAFEENKQSISPFFFSLLKYGYSQANDYETTLKIFDEKELNTEELYFKYVLYNKVNKKEEASKALLEFINVINKIDDHNIAMVLDGILSPSVKLIDIESFYENLCNNKISTTGLYKDILIATKGTKNETHKETSLNILENNFKSICDESHKNEGSIHAYCRVLHEFKLWNGIVTVLQNKNLNSFRNKSLMIEGLWHSKQNSTLLLSLLEEMRNSDFPQINEYYIWEINLNQLLGEWGKLMNIAIQGCVLFPGDRAFKYHLSASYLNLEKKNEFCDSIENLDLLSFPFKHFHALIEGLLHFDEYPKGVEYIYQYSLSNKEPLSKMFFFNAFLLNYEKVIQSIPIYCEHGYVIKIQSETKSILVNEISHKDIYEKLVGKKIQDRILLPAAMTGKDVEYKIISIHHKYDIFLEEIQKEAENPELSGLPMIAFRLKDGGTIEEWNDQLSSLFGESGDQRNIHIEKQINLYKSNSASFLQLTRSVFNDDIFDAFHSTTSSPELGFRIISNSLFRNVIPENCDKLCLDLPSLILISEQANKLNISDNRIYIISEHTLEYIDGLLNNIEGSAESNLSLNITSKGVIPFDNTIYKANKKQRLKQCKTWIENNCEILTSKNKLDFLLQFQKENVVPNSLVLSYLDTFSLSVEHNKVLISDEKIALPILKSSELIVSTEWFFKTLGNQYTPDTLFEMLTGLNFIGVEIPASKINLVSNIISEELPEKVNILQNFSIKNSANTSNVLVLIKVMEKTLEKAISKDKKNDILNMLFSHLLEGIYDNEGLLQDVVTLTRLGLIELFYRDKNKHKIISNELFKVLKHNNIEVILN